MARAGDDPVPAPCAGKVALVTGAAGGIGAAVCAGLARAGAIPVGLDVRRPAPGSLPEVLQGDVGEDADVAAAIAAVEARHQRLDILVHCAALPQGGVAWKLPVDEWDRVIRTNLRSAFLLAHHAIPVLRRGGADGRIVMIGSTVGAAGGLGQSAYAASKAGMVGFAKSIARETARFGIRVNVVEPGITRTAMSEALPQSARDAAVAATLTGAITEPGDVAAMVVFLCGPGGRQVTGQVLRVDGGALL